MGKEIMGCLDLLRVKRRRYGVEVRLRKSGNLHNLAMFQPYCWVVFWVAPGRGSTRDPILAMCGAALKRKLPFLLLARSSPTVMAAFCPVATWLVPAHNILF